VVEQGAARPGWRARDDTIEPATIASCAPSNRTVIGRMLVAGAGSVTPSQMRSDRSEFTQIAVR